MLALKAVGVPLPQFAHWPAALAVTEMLILWIITLHRLRFPHYLAFFYPISMLLFLSIAFRSLAWTATGRTAWKGRPLPRQRVRLI